MVIVPDATARHSGAPQVASAASRSSAAYCAADTVCGDPMRCHAAYELLWYSLIQDYRWTSARVFDRGRPLTVTSTAAAGPRTSSS